MAYAFVLNADGSTSITSLDSIYNKNVIGAVDINKLTDTDILIAKPGFSLQVKTTDIATIAGAAPSGTIDDIILQLRAVFLNAGGSAGTTPNLEQVTEVSPATPNVISYTPKMINEVDNLQNKNIIWSVDLFEPPIIRSQVQISHILADAFIGQNLLISGNDVNGTYEHISAVITALSTSHGVTTMDFQLNETPEFDPAAVGGFNLTFFGIIYPVKTVFEDTEIPDMAAVNKAIGKNIYRETPEDNYDATINDEIIDVIPTSADHQIYLPVSDDVPIGKRYTVRRNSGSNTDAIQITTHDGGNLIQENAGGTFVADVSLAAEWGNIGVSMTWIWTGSNYILTGII